VCAKSALDIPRVRRVAELIVEELKRTRRRECGGSQVRSLL
jgi:hypothetical protein